MSRIQTSSTAVLSEEKEKTRDGSNTEKILLKNLINSCKLKCKQTSSYDQNVLKVVSRKNKRKIKKSPCQVVKAGYTLAVVWRIRERLAT